MTALAGRFLLLICFFLPWLRLDAFASASAATVTVTQLSPQVCPPGGCAAGQRINFKADFSFSSFDPSQDPNVQICVYNPINWSPTQFEMATTGGVSSISYLDSITNCASAPAEYDLTGGRLGKAASGSLGDSLTFNMRLGNAASLDGAMLVKVIEKNTSGNWVETGQSFTSLPVEATAATVYVANDATACGANAPCYLNSGDDQVNGYGTGLKDALDAAPLPSTVKILGDYQIKRNTVLVNRGHTIQGVNNASITYNGTDCTQSMLSITAGATVKNLMINDGACTSTHRNLIAIGSSSKVIIESNDLQGGADAIYLLGSNTAAVDVLFNEITGNAGYGIYSTSGNTGALDVVGNNIYGNRSGAQVECYSPTNRVVDHNFWGAGVLPVTAANQCTSTATKRLGARVEHNITDAGVSVKRVTVSSTLTYAFNNQIGYQRTGGGDFDIYIVNHGYGTVDNVPFTGGQTANLTACSNYWDIFLANSGSLPTTTAIQLFFKYNLSSGCINNIELPLYCGQTSNPASYPLFWYDIGTNTWAATGRSPGGQDTTCLMSSDEIKVNIDQIDGRPNFVDLQRLPFVIGLPGTQGAVVINSFTASPGDRNAFIRWTTASEVGVYAFSVMRSSSYSGTYTDVSPRIQPLGNSSTGGSYEYVDTGLTNGSSYFYRLKIINYDLSYVLGGIISVVPVPPTVTPTPTPSITPTRTRTDIIPTNTRTRTTFPTSTFFFRTATRTVTATATPTSPFKTVTITLTPTPSKPVTATQRGSVSPSIDAATELANQRATRTAAAKTTSPNAGTPGSNGGSDGMTPITAVLGILAGGAVAGGFFLWLRERRN